MKPQQKKITVATIKKKKEKGEKIVAITAYDAPTAKFAEAAGVDLILVGDSLGMTVLGYSNTIPVRIEQSLHHCAAVMRGVQKTLVIGDMPFMTYHISTEQALKNAARYLQEAQVDAVKIEGGAEMEKTITALVRAGIPVMAHIGLLPQHLKAEGKYKVYGKTDTERKKLLDDAKAVEDAGAFCIVLESIPAEIGKEITAQLTIPTIGIGAGPYCDGQIQVIHDILGMFDDFMPKHAKQYVNLKNEIITAIKSYIHDVNQGNFPDKEHSFFLDISNSPAIKKTNT